MKKLLIVMAALALLICGCAKKEKIVVDFENHTISDGTHTYEYTDTREGDVRTVVIHYPDGGVYTWTQDSLFGSGNMKHGSSMETFTDGHALLQAVLGTQDADEWENADLRWVLIVVGILFTGYSLWTVCCPVAVWDIFMRRWYREDPGEFALTQIISRGIRGIVLGIGIILIALFV